MTLEGIIQFYTGTTCVHCGHRTPPHDGALLSVRASLREAIMSLVAEKDAELERLRAENEKLRGELRCGFCGAKSAPIDDQWSEIARLRRLANIFTAWNCGPTVKHDDELDWDQLMLAEERWWREARGEFDEKAFVESLLAECRAAKASKCPGCAKGAEPMLLDEHGTFTSVSGLPGRPGHAVDDFWWYCDQYAARAARAKEGE